MEPRRNLELKARDPDPGSSFAVAAGLGLGEARLLEQCDTYFEVPHGRLKLREEGSVAQLIAYERPDERRWKESRYAIVEVAEAGKLRELLADSLGVRGVVEKRRRQFARDGVQVHLDEVAELGSFIEFELAVAADADLDRARVRLDELRASFNILDRDLVAGSYADLVD